MKKVIGLLLGLIVLTLSACSVEDGTVGGEVNKVVQNAFDAAGSLVSKSENNESEVEIRKADEDWPDKESDRPLSIKEVKDGLEMEVSEDKNKELVESKEEQKAEFAVRGIVEGNYYNSWAGIQLDIGEDWVVTADNQLLNSLGSERPSMGAELGSSELASEFIDFNAKSGLGGELTVVFRETEFTQELDYISYLIKQPEFISLGVEVKLKDIPIRVGDYDWYGYNYYTGISGVHVSTDVYVKIIDKVVVVITQEGTSEQSTSLTDILKEYQ